MKIKTQFIICIVVFSSILLIIGVSVAITEQQVSRLSAQEQISSSIERGASSLNSIAIDYFLYQEDLQLSRWQSTLSSLSSDLSNLEPNSPQQQTLANNVADDLQRLNSLFDEVSSYLQSASRNVSVRIDPAFQIRWSNMAIQSRTLAFDASQLSSSLNDQAHQANNTNTLLIVSLVGAFGAFLATIYLVVFRRALKSVAELQNGINTIGSGNLEYVIKTKRQDEIAELSHSFNKMTTNLKTVTASKTELEREIVGRKQAEIGLRESEQRWATTLASIGDAVIATDLSGKITFMNGVAEELTGWTLGEVMEKPVKQVFNIVNEQTRREVEDPVAKVLEKGLIIGLANHTILLRKDGTEIPIDDSGAPIRDKEGKTTGVVLVFRDITERKRVQGLLEDRTAQVEEYAQQMEQLANERAQKLKDAERLAAIGATAGMVGHDIRNPLQAIIGDVYLAKSDVNSLPQDDSKTSLQESLAAIEKNTEYINKIVADLQDFARPLNPHVEETDLNGIISDLITKNGMPTNIKRRVKIAKETQTLATDPAYMKRILGNLITNAVQAMPKGGRLTINATAKDNNTIITVQDTGVGIPEEAKTKIFMPLFTTKSKGQGFGLPVVKRMTEALNGTVTFQSQTGKGTKFTIQIPTNAKPH